MKKNKEKNKKKNILKDIFLIVLFTPGILLLFLTPIYVLMLMSEVFVREFSAWHAWMIISYVGFIFYLSGIRFKKKKIK